MESKMNEKIYKRIIIGLSVVIPLVVAALFSVKIEGADFSYLPFYYAMVNALTAVLLIMAFIAIRKGHRKWHQRLIVSSLVLSVIFLVMYVLYHMTSEPTVFGGEGIIKSIYYTLLISHILLSVVVIPLVLITLMRAVLKDFTRHKRLARYAFPMWLYVTISGVIVYILISPYYQ